MALTDLLGIPVDQVFQGVLLPALIIFAILWALLGSVKVFSKKINLVLSLALTLLVINSPQFAFFASYLTVLGAQISIAVFFILFAVGAALMFVRKGADIYYEQNPSRKMDKLLKRKAECLEKARRAGENGKMAEKREWQKKANEYNDEIEMLMSKE